MSTLVKRTIPMAIVFVVGLLMILDFFISTPALQSAATFLSEIGVILAAFALGLGVVNMTWIHVRHIQRRTEGQWMHSIVLLLGLYPVLAFGLIGGTNQVVYKFFFDNVIAVAGTAVYAVLSFYTIAAAYRAFRVRNINSTIMMIVGIIVFLGVVPIGQLISPVLPQIKTWIQDYPSVGATRAIQIGVALAAIVLTLKTLIGIERAYLGGEAGE